jgi:hypothetical protein
MMTIRSIITKMAQDSQEEIRLWIDVILTLSHTCSSPWSDFLSIIHFVPFGLGLQHPCYTTLMQLMDATTQQPQKFPTSNKQFFFLKSPKDI